MSYRFASLSSGLLARKGTALPAMTSHAGGNPRPLREQVSFVTVHEPEPSFRPNAVLAKAGFGFEPSPPPPFPESPVRLDALPAAVPPRVAEPAKARPFDADAACGGPTACAIADQSAVDPAKRFHVSVRLRQGHFVRLKLASAQLRRPSQEIVADALSAYFRSLDPAIFGTCACSRE